MDQLQRPNEHTDICNSAGACLIFVTATVAAMIAILVVFANDARKSADGINQWTLWVTVFGLLLDCYQNELETFSMVALAVNFGFDGLFNY